MGLVSYLYPFLCLSRAMINIEQINECRGRKDGESHTDEGHDIVPDNH